MAAEGLLRFMGFKLPMEMSTVKASIPPHKLIFDLPSYCYDVHTRIGLATLRWLTHGVRGAEGIRDLLRDNQTENPHRALGEALFNVEGGRIRGELIYGPLCHLEQKVYAHQYGLSLDTWLRLQMLVERAITDGVIDRVRGTCLISATARFFAIDCSEIPHY